MSYTRVTFRVKPASLSTVREMKNICDMLAFQTSHRVIQERNDTHVSNYCAVRQFIAQDLLKTSDQILLGKVSTDSLRIPLTNSI